jgi:hypothetical protein
LDEFAHRFSRHLYVSGVRRRILDARGEMDVMMKGVATAPGVIEPEAGCRHVSSSPPLRLFLSACPRVPPFVDPVRRRQ